MIQLALRGALSDRAAGGQVAVVESLELGSPEHQGRVRLPSPRSGLPDEHSLSWRVRTKRAYKSFRNLRRVDLVLVPELTAYDVLCSDWVVFTEPRFRATAPGERLRWRCHSEGESRLRGHLRAGLRPKRPPHPLRSRSPKAKRDGHRSAGRRRAVAAPRAAREEAATSPISEAAGSEAAGAEAAGAEAAGAEAAGARMPSPRMATRLT